MLPNMDLLYMKTIIDLPSESFRDKEQPKETLIPVSYHARAAIVIGAGVFAGLSAVMIAFDVEIIPTLKFAGVAGALAAAVFTVYWTAISTTEPITAKRSERLRRWKIEDYLPPVEDDPIPANDFTIPERLRLVGFHVLSMHYVEGSKATRPECENVGITQGDWNLVNKALIDLGIKSSRGWVIEDYLQALTLWQSNIQIMEDNTALIKTGESNWKRIHLGGK